MLAVDGAATACVEVLHDLLRHGVGRRRTTWEFERCIAPQWSVDRFHAEGHDVLVAFFFGEYRNIGFEGRFAGCIGADTGQAQVFAIRTQEHHRGIGFEQRETGTGCQMGARQSVVDDLMPLGRCGVT